MKTGRIASETHWDTPYLVGVLHGGGGIYTSYPFETHKAAAQRWNILSDYAKPDVLRVTLYERQESGDYQMLAEWLREPAEVA